VVNELFSLSLQAQLGVLRTVAPKILARLHADGRAGFLRDLNEEVELAIRGRETYDLRSNLPRTPDQPYTQPIIGIRPGGLHEDAGPGSGARFGSEVPVEFRRPKHYTRSDERVLEEVCEALGRLEQLDLSDVEIGVRQGEVTLTGTVPERVMKYQIEMECERIPFVQEIHDQLRVPNSKDFERRARRHAVRAMQTYAAFMREVQEHVPVPRDEAERIVLAVIGTLEQRLISTEATDLEAQLPSLLQDLLQASYEPTGRRPRDIDKKSFIATIADRLEISPEQAEEWARGVFRTLENRVSAGEIEQVKNMLPEDIRALWSNSSAG
jgi:uncharacterized protein (DUF2267 family)